MDRRKGMLFATGATFLLLVSGIASGGFFDSKSTTVSSGAATDLTSQPLPIVSSGGVNTASTGGATTATPADARGSKRYDRDDDERRARGGAIAKQSGRRADDD